MGSFKRPHAFDPLDMEIIDLVYEVAWEQVSAREPSPIWRRMKSGRLRYGSASSPSLVAAGLISTLDSTECLRVCRSLGPSRPIETTFK